jgi:hypothetical protein
MHFAVVGVVQDDGVEGLSTVPVCDRNFSE